MTIQASEKGKTERRLPAVSSREVAAFLILTALGILGNIFSASLLFGVEFVFGGVAVFLVLRLFGLRWGVLSAVVAGSYTVVLWHHPYAMIIFLTEIIAVGLMRRRVEQSLPLLDALYWLFLGMPMVWLFYHTAMHVAPEATSLVMVKQGVNGICNALLASLILAHTPLRAWTGRPAEHPVSFRQTLFDLLVAMMLFPALVLLILDSQQEMARVDRDIRSRMALASTSIVSRLDRWQMRHLGAVEAAAGIAVRDGLREGTRPYPFSGTAAAIQESISAIHVALPDYQNMYVANGAGITVAFHPLTNAAGRRLTGLSFADRDYYREMRFTGRPVVSDVFLGRGGVTGPVVTVGAPAVRRGKFLGYAMGALNMQAAAEMLSGTLAGQDLRATLIDRQGHVIVSTHPDLRPMDRFPLLTDPGLVSLGDDTYRWMPRGAGIPPVTRWRDSLYVQKAMAHSSPWMIVVEAPVAPYQALLQGRYTRSLAVLFALSLATLLLASILAAWLTTPLSELAAVSTNLPDRLMSGETLRWPESRITEVRALVQNYQTTLRALRQHFQAVLGANETLERQGRELAERNVTLAREVAERRRIEEERLDLLRREQQSRAELERLYDMAQEEARRKDEFLAMLAHELRNPLGAVSNALHVLRRSNGNPTVRERAMGVLERQIRHQTRMVDDLLDVSRVTRGKLALRREPVDLVRIVRNTAEDHRGGMEAAGLHLVLDTDDGPVWVNGDATRLAQVLGNLLHNAQKFTPFGGTVTVSLHPEGNGMVSLHVRDTGAGIAPDVLPDIFEAFSQGDRSLDRRLGGLGLGLALVRGIVEFHGGWVSATSGGPGQGTEITVRLPIAEAGGTSTTPVSAPEVEAAGPQRRVLVIEDNPDAADTLRDVLELRGHEVCVAHSGPEGIEAARAFHPDAVLCDIGLPGMDGYEVAAALRREPAASEARIIAVSGYGREEDRERSQAAGFDDHLTKPVDLRELDRLLAGT